MKRNIIYFIYEVFKDWKGCAVILGLYMLIHIYLKLFLSYMGWDEIFATPAWGAGGILLFSWLTKAGYKIELEKKRFEYWRDIVSSSNTNSGQKEEAAWKILRSKDVNQYALNDLFFHFKNNKRIINSVLDKYNELKLKTPEHERN
jgi:hypothetical protein